MIELPFSNMEISSAQIIIGFSDCNHLRSLAFNCIHMLVLVPLSFTCFFVFSFAFIHVCMILVTFTGFCLFSLFSLTLACVYLLSSVVQLR